MALQLAAVTATAQNYYIKISGDKGTHVADHAGWENGPVALNETLETYNLDLPSGDKSVGLMRFYSPTGSMAFASHYRLNSAPEQVIAKKILMPVFNNELFVIGEKLASNGSVKSAVALLYDKNTGVLLKSNELPFLPDGYAFRHVYDVIEEVDQPNIMRILCIVEKEGKESIMELIYNANTNLYKIKRYDPVNVAPDKYLSVYYVRAYHYSEFNLGKISFYGMGVFKGKTVGYCYLDGKYQRYHLYSAHAIEEVTGIQMNGSYGPDGSKLRIDMAFVDAEGDLCIQQKDNMGSANWRRFYRMPEAPLRMGWGRDGHGTKQGGGMSYFIGTAKINGGAPDGQITGLNYDAANGNMAKAHVYNLSGIGVNKDGGFPNTTYDPGYDFTFIADRYKQENGFKIGVGDPAGDAEKFCAKPAELKEVRNTLKEEKDDVKVSNYELFEAKEIEMVAVPIEVSVVEECKTEQRPSAQQQGINGLFQDNAGLYMNTEHLTVKAEGKTMNTVRVFSIDGRMVSESQNVNSDHFEQQFSHALTPGIYLVRIGYTDHSTEVRKVSVR